MQGSSIIKLDCSVTPYDGCLVNGMPFGLKIAGATYQRMMDMFFKDNIGRNLEVYVDDMVVKTKGDASRLQDLAEIFTQLRHYGMKLNPNKCAFRVNGGKFSGFILTYRGIETNPEQCKTILEMKSPKTVKEVQRLNGRIPVSHRFMAR